MEEIQKITLAYNKILAAIVDPDVIEVFGDGRVFPEQESLPEIHVDDCEPQP